MLPLLSPDKAKNRAQSGGLKLLALDLGDNLGTATLFPDGGVKHKAYKFEGDFDLRFHRFRLLLSSINKSIGGLDAVFYENKDFVGKWEWFTVRVAYGYWGNLLSWGRLYGVETKPLAIGTIKKFATGSGNAPKTMAEKEKKNAAARKKGKPEYLGITIEEAVRAMGFEPADHNAADGLAILALGLEQEIGKQNAARKVG